MVDLAKKITGSPSFKIIVLSIILLSALITGLETYPQYFKTFYHWFIIADRVIVAAFAIELAFRLTAHGKNIWRFFTDPWNVFDFVIVLLCFLPADVHFIGILRIVRILRVLRLISILPKLQLLVNTLIKSIPSIGYVIVLLTILFFIYGVLGCFIFGLNDPIHFGNLHKAMLTLFSVVTLEGWVEILKINMYGCSNFGYENEITKCIHSNPQPFAAVLYFISFILIGSMIFINLFIGVVMNSMAESERELSLNKVKTKDKDNLLVHLDNMEEKMELLKKEIMELSEKIKSGIINR